MLLLFAADLAFFWKITIRIIPIKSHRKKSVKWEQNKINKNQEVIKKKLKHLRLDSEKQVRSFLVLNLLCFWNKSQIYRLSELCLHLCQILKKRSTWVFEHIKETVLMVDFEMNMQIKSEAQRTTSKQIILSCSYFCLTQNEETASTVVCFFFVTYLKID